MEIAMKDHHTPTEMTASERLNPALIKQLSRLKPWLSLSHVALEYVFIISAIVLCTLYWHPLLYVVCVMWIGARQHALAILVHEAAHYRLIKHKPTNDFIGEALLAFPIFVTLRGYRVSHRAHHRHMNTEYDPDWVSKETPDWEFPKSRAALFLMLAKIACGMNLFWMIKLIIKGGQPEAATQTSKAKKAFVAGRIVYYVTVIAVLTYFGWWLEFLLFWIVPLVTWLQVIFRIRSIAEHFGLEYDHTFTEARTTYPSLFDRLFIASKNVWYHLDHHLYPSVPFYNLPHLHEKLMELTGFQERAHITKSYLGVLRECSTSLAKMT